MDGGELIPTSAYADPTLAELTEEITRRLQSGESVEADSYANQHPECVGPISELLPTLHDLVDLGKSVRLGCRLEPDPFRPTIREN
jgi:hypothetical protein